jgi:hypothetical protein
MVRGSPVPPGSPARGVTLDDLLTRYATSSAHDVAGVYLAIPHGPHGVNDTIDAGDGDPRPEPPG